MLKLKKKKWSVFWWSQTRVRLAADFLIQFSWLLSSSFSSSPVTVANLSSLFLILRVNGAAAADFTNSLCSLSPALQDCICGKASGMPLPPPPPTPPTHSPQSRRSHRLPKTSHRKKHQWWDFPLSEANYLLWIWTLTCIPFSGNTFISHRRTLTWI